MEVKKRILDKATEQFMRYGIRSVSMDDIASLLGISKKTIYQYFSDKEQLVDAVMQEEEKRTHNDCSHCRQHSVDAVQEMFLAMQQITEQFSHMNPVILYDLEKFHPSVFQRFLRLKNSYIYGVIKENINRGIEEGYYRSEINVDTISLFRIESIMMGFNLSVFPPSKYNLAEVTREIMIHFLFGLATQQGYKRIQQYMQQKSKN
jgi:AcrR family transcriptional regulator